MPAIAYAVEHEPRSSTSRASQPRITLAIHGVELEYGAKPRAPTCVDYAAEDLVAESVAHLAVSFVGLDSSASAVRYLAVWSESAAPDTLERVAGLVDRLARRLEQALGAEDTEAAVIATAA